ncbi:hypothetical protein BDV97DRAFT_79432 [Delphinella strobiligena]|nr:hypothetical protein BDV97DRAFT_79432 [Delphinella strobiligena]
MSSGHPGHYESMFIKCEPLVPAGERTTAYSGSEMMDDVPVAKFIIQDALEGIRAGEISTIHNGVIRSVERGDLQQSDTIADQVDSVIKEARKRFLRAKLERINCCQIALLTTLRDFEANLAISPPPRKEMEMSQAGSTRDEDENIQMEGFSSDESSAEEQAQSIRPLQRHQYSKLVNDRDNPCLQHHEQMQVWLKSLKRKRTHLARRIAKREAMTEAMQRGRLDVEGVKIFSGAVRSSSRGKEEAAGAVTPQ